MVDGQTTDDSGNASDQWNLMTFRLHQQIYALPIEPIAQIILMVTIIPVPQVGDVVEGAINVRGTAVPVVNLGRHLGLPQVPLQLHTPIILAQIKEQMVGLIVDEVIDVFSLADDQTTRLADVLPEELGEAPILQGLVHISGSMVPLLDHEHLFLPDQVQVLIQAMEILAEEMSPQIVAQETSEESHLDKPAEEIEA
jgi:purine-binding chemotaxis protein CheW